MSLRASEESEQHQHKVCVCAATNLPSIIHIFYPTFHEDYFLSKPSLISDILTVLPYTILYYTKIINYVCIIINYRDIEIERDRKRREKGA
jgi:hypothetical protein